MIKRLLLLLIVITCQNLIAEESPIVILYSDDNKSYRQPATLFKESLTRKILEYSLHGDVERAPKVLTELMKTKPAIIFALGAKAAWFAKIATKKHPSTKVLFAMVINWQRYNLLDGQSNITGISNDIAPGTQLFNLSLVSPKTKRVGVIYSKKYSKKIIDQGRDAAQLLGLELVAESIENMGSFKRAWRKMSSTIDAFWVLTDPLLYTLENIHWLSDRCLKENIACIGQSANITKLGVLLSINPDNETVGLQAVALANSILEKGSINVKRRVTAPIGTMVSFNSHTANKIGLTVNSDVLLMVNKVINN